MFFCKYNDPIYVKLAKLEIMYRLASEENVKEVLAELEEYVSDVVLNLTLHNHRHPGMHRRWTSTLCGKPCAR